MKKKLSKFGIISLSGLCLFVGSILIYDKIAYMIDSKDVRDIEEKLSDEKVDTTLVGRLNKGKLKKPFTDDVKYIKIGL